MVAAPATEPAPEPLIGLGWVWRLRWGTLIGQVAAFIVARIFLQLHLEIVTLVVLLAALLLSNFALARWRSRSDAARRVTALVLVFDTALLTAVLYWSGGVANPFSAFYIVYVAIAALVLGGRWALGMIAITALAFASLFWVPAERLGPHAHHLASPLHLQGMWAAYVLSAGFVAYFVSKVATALREREAETQRLQAYAAAVERVASLSTLAAGAAHELGSPLSSIAVSAGELVQGLDGQEGLAVEARHIRAEVERCRAIIDQLVQSSGQQSGEVPVWADLRDVVDTAAQELEPGARERVKVEWGPLERPSIRCPRRTLTQVLGNLMKNALDAGADGRDAVELAVSVKDATVQFEVRDRGIGVTPEVLARSGEPFFTTKEPGKGMGLGLFLVKSFARQAGGAFRLEPREGGGATATLTLGVDLLQEPHDQRS